jgi:hypothetical protein
MISDEEDATHTFCLQDFEFDTKQVPHPTILLVGKRFSGKSTTAVAIAEHFTVPRWAAWCGTKDTQDYWADRFGSSATVWGPDDNGKAALARIIKYQQRKVRLYKTVLHEPFPEKYSMGLLFDDITSNRNFRKGEMLEDLFSNGRHYKAVLIISCQYLKQLPPAVRTNTDYLFMLHNAKRTCKLLYEEYVENPDDFNVFLGLLRMVTGQKDDRGKDLYNALVYDNVIKTYKLDEMFYIYRHYEGYDPSKVRLGDPQWQEFNREHFKDTEKEEQERAHRRKKRMMRLQEYRDQQEKLGGGGLEDVDLDYVSDSDGSEGGAADDVDVCTVRRKRGQSIKFNIGRGRRKAGGGRGGHTRESRSTSSDDEEDYEDDDEEDYEDASSLGEVSNCTQPSGKYSKPTFRGPPPPPAAGLNSWARSRDFVRRNSVRV